MKNEGKTEQGIIIGYDRRFLSKESMRWLGQVFAAEGIKAMLVNRACPTPLIMFYVQTLTNRLEEEQKNQTQDKLMKSLVAIRDILNYMTFSKVSNN